MFVSPFVTHLGQSLVVLVAVFTCSHAVAGWVTCFDSQVTAVFGCTQSDTVLVGSLDGRLALIDSVKKIKIGDVKLKGRVVRIACDETRLRWYCVSYIEDVLFLYSGRYSMAAIGASDWQFSVQASAGAVEKSFENALIEVAPNGKWVCVVSYLRKRVGAEYCTFAVDAKDGKVVVAPTLARCIYPVERYAEFDLKRCAFWGDEKLTILEVGDRKVSSIRVVDLSNARPPVSKEIQGSVWRLCSTRCGETFAIGIDNRQRSGGHVQNKLEWRIWSGGGLVKVGEFAVHPWVFKHELDCAGAQLYLTSVSGPQNSFTFRLFLFRDSLTTPLFHRFIGGWGQSWEPAWSVNGQLQQCALYFPGVNELNLVDIDGSLPAEVTSVGYSQPYGERTELNYVGVAGDSIAFASVPMDPRLSGPVLAPDDGNRGDVYIHTIGVDEKTRASSHAR